MHRLLECLLPEEVYLAQQQPHQVDMLPGEAWTLVPGKCPPSLLAPLASSALHLSLSAQQPVSG